ncbi:MAG: 7-cyano-7-deazaguanine synthase QueC [Oscillospiraceae bacterium]|nr:7-cyano-7-deazaguanine synthase QueC [Oscillospiraceae bacterium]
MKALVLSSGGVDSTTLLAEACEEYGRENVTALSLYYGQKHKKELEASAAVAEYYGVEHIVSDLSVIFAYSDCTLLEGRGDIPHESYAEQLEKTDGSPVSTYVPFRNGLFLSAAASIALSKECGVLMYGAHSDDAAGNAYPDCSTEFVEAMDRAINLGSGGELTVRAPFAGVNKTEVVRRGKALGVPYQLTWSCYEGGDKPCGRCATCIDRIKAFRANGITID